MVFFQQHFLTQSRLDSLDFSLDEVLNIIRPLDVNKVQDVIMIYLD